MCVTVGATRTFLVRRPFGSSCDLTRSCAAHFVRPRDPLPPHSHPSRCAFAGRELQAVVSARARQRHGDRAARRSAPHRRHGVQCASAAPTEAPPARTQRAYVRSFAENTLPLARPLCRRSSRLRTRASPRVATHAVPDGRRLRRRRGYFPACGAGVLRVDADAVRAREPRDGADRPLRGVHGAARPGAGRAGHRLRFERHRVLRGDDWPGSGVLHLGRFLCACARRAGCKMCVCLFRVVACACGAGPRGNACAASAALHTSASHRATAALRRLAPSTYHKRRRREGMSGDH